MKTRAEWALLCTAGIWALVVGVMILTPGRGLVSVFAQAEHGLAASQQAGGDLPALGPDELVDVYCQRCHNDTLLRGGLSLEAFDPGDAAAQADIAERMINKLQTGMMPPPGSRRPDEASLNRLLTLLETTVDEAAAARPHPGGRTFQRLNRPEYARAIKDLFGLDVDAGNWLPLDAKSANFDNIADEQMLSATLLEAYLNAAADISRMVVGDRNAPAVDSTYTNTSYVSQHPWDHVEGAPYGTRGGIVVDHVFPADAEYVFEMGVTSGNNSRLEDLDLSINGERLALVRYETGQPDGADGRGAVPMLTEPVFVKAGQHRVAAAFIRRTDGPYEDLIRPHDWSYAGGGSGGAGITTLPHLRDLIIRGPLNATGVSQTASRAKVFACRPTSAADERPCAERIASRVGGAAYRRPLSGRELYSVMQFYDLGAADDGFEGGVRSLVEAILASPHFVFRLEPLPADATPGAAVAVNDLALASRLSFFLWGAPPDAELLSLAEAGTLASPAALESQTRRMLADPRTQALGSRFAAQWLRLQDVDKVKPDPNFYPNFDDGLSAAMVQETETFFNYLVAEDRSALDLYRADYTFANERLARHYGIPGVAGARFRRVDYPDDTRRGLLGHGSVLVQTSMANRTSPVLRGKWVMEVLLGSPPPPPPPDVPDLDETAGAADGRILTTRERLEIHREDPTCNACHRFMDPIGLALDNFDVTGRWRAREYGMPLDTQGTFYDGTPVETPADLTAALMKRPEPLLRTFTENLMSYALGRRVEYFDQPAIRAIVRAAAGDNFRMSAFILGVVQSDAFRLQLVEPDPMASAGRDDRRH